jgi:hypothetical protein
VLLGDLRHGRLVGLAGDLDVCSPVNRFLRIGRPRCVSRAPSSDVSAGPRIAREVRGWFLPTHWKSSIIMSMLAVRDERPVQAVAPPAGCTFEPGHGELPARRTHESEHLHRPVDLEMIVATRSTRSGPSSSMVTTAARSRLGSWRP